MCKKYISYYFCGLEYLIDDALSTSNKKSAMGTKINNIYTKYDFSMHQKNQPAFFVLFVNN